MCQDCGCGDMVSVSSVVAHSADDKVVEINASVNAVNDALASQLADHLKKKGVLCVNVMGAPGAGKTTFIESLAKHIDPSQIAVIQGDLESDVDKQRLERSGIAAFQINTHSGCHLNASMINSALLDFPLKDKQYLFVENVGNLVCPAGVRLGQHLDLVLSATTEGSDKPKKYPHIFSGADATVITKCDIAKAVGFDEESYLADLSPIIGKKKVFKTSLDASSVKDVVHFLAHRREHLLGIDHHHHH